MSYTKTTPLRLSSYLEQHEQALRLELNHHGWSCWSDSDPSGTSKLLFPNLGAGPHMRPTAGLAPSLQQALEGAMAHPDLARAKVTVNSEWLTIPLDADKRLQAAMHQRARTQPELANQSSALIIERERGGSWAVWLADAWGGPRKDSEHYSDRHKNLADAWVAAEKVLQTLGCLKTKHHVPDID